MRFDAAKYPSVSWDAISFVGGAAGDVCEVRLLDYATLLSGSETPASVTCGISGRTPVWGTDVLHLYFRDTRYTVSHADCRWEGTMAEDLIGSTEMQWITVEDPTGNIAHAQEDAFDGCTPFEIFESGHGLPARAAGGDSTTRPQPRRCTRISEYDHIPIVIFDTNVDMSLWA